MISEEEKKKMKDFIHMGAGIPLDSIENALLEYGLKMYNFEIRNAYSEAQKVTIECYQVGNAQKYNAHKNVTPKNIFKNGLYTTVLWADVTKTIVKRGEDEPDDEYSAFTAALARKIYGTNSAVKRIVRMTKVQSKKYKEPKDTTEKDNPANPFSALADAIVNSVAKVTETMSKPKDACPIEKPCEKSTVEHDLDAMNRHDEDWHEILDKLPDSEKEKLIETLLKEAEGRKYPPVYYIFKAMSGEKDKELEDRLNTQAKKQYEEYMKQNTANDMWTCPKCGKRYQWQYNAEGRYAFCPHCQLATKTAAKA